MKARLVSSVVLAAAVALGATGCGLFAPQATSYEYAPSDGVSVNAGDVKVRNALFVTNDDASAFNLSFTAVVGEKAQTLKITTVVDGVRTSQEVSLKSGSTQFGDKKAGEKTVVFSGIKAEAGQTITTYFQAGSSDEVKQAVPVLDGTLAEYKPLVPSET